MKKKTKKQTKSKGKTPTAKLPDRMKFQPEGRGISPDEPPEVFDPNFPGRKAPTEQWLIDRDFIWKIKDLPTFLMELKVIIKYWTFYDNPNLFGHYAIRITWEIFQRGEQLRQEYLEQHPELIIRPLINDLYEMESWQFDAERAVREETLKELPLDFSREPITLKKFIEKALRINRARNENLRRQLSKYKSKGDIEYPPEAGTAKEGQSKRYKPEDLLTHYKQWRVIKPDLPPFDVTPR